MPIAGATDTAQVDLEVYGGDTEAELEVTFLTDGTAITPPTVAVDYGNPDLVNKSWRARVPYPDPGLYLHTWTITGTGEGIQTLTVAVAPADASGDPRHSYATPTDLANYLHEAPPLDSMRLLRQATAAIDDWLLCEVYDVDDDGMPTHPEVIAAFTEAVCEQVRWREETGGDDADAMAGYTSMSIAGVSLGRSPDAKGTRRNRVAPKVPAILAKAPGLTGHGPWTY